jgi:hypothetical protein
MGIFDRYNQQFETNKDSNDGWFPAYEFPQQEGDHWSSILWDLHDAIFNLWNLKGVKQAPVFVEYIRRDEINGYVAKLDNPREYLIGIPYGAIPRLFGFFHTIVARINFMPEAGEANHRAKRIDFEKFLFGDSSDFSEVFESGKNRYRRTFANVLFYIAIEYIFLHEISHVLLGHLGYSHSKIKGVSNLCMHEGRNESIDGISKKELRAMEIDADANAIYLALNMHRRGISPILNSPRFNSAFNLDIDFLAKCLLISSSLLIHFFPSAGAPLSINRFQSHPHSEVRINNIYLRLLYHTGIDTRSKGAKSPQWAAEAMGSLHAIFNEGFGHAFLPNSSSHEIDIKTGETKKIRRERKTNLELLNEDSQTVSQNMEKWSKHAYISRSELEPGSEKSEMWWTETGLNIRY